jgi:hypothetical protein
MPETYETDIEIDESALDVEWVGHASLMLRYTRTAAESHKEMNLAKARLDYVKARLDKEIRENPDAYGLGTRITEGSISSAIRLSEDFEEANHGLIEKEFEYEVAAGVVRSFDHRKSALENLVRLHAQSYFAGPSVPHNLSEERSKRANRHIRFQRRS